MKTLFAVLLLGVASVAQAQVTAPIPPKSSISISPRQSQTPPEHPSDGRCNGKHLLTTYVPTVRLGADAGTEPVRWRLFVITKDKEGVKVTKVADRKIKPGAPVSLHPVTADERIWICHPECRKRNKENPQQIGWYSDLVAADGTTVVSAKPLGGNVDFEKLVAERPKIRAQIGWALQFYSAETNLSKGATQTTVVAYAQANVPGVLKITTKKGEVAVVQFEGIQEHEIPFRWKYKAAATKPLETGEGVLRQSYSENEQGKMMLDEESCTRVEAGGVGFNAGRSRGRTISYQIDPDLATVEVLPAEAFDSSL